MDARALTFGTLIVQFIIFGLVAYSSYLSIIRKNLRRHCLQMRVAVALLIINMLAVMLPSLVSFVANERPETWFYLEQIVHHTIGLAVIGLFVFINLAFSGVIKLKHRLQIYMRLAAGLWVLSFFIGVHIYFLLW